MFWHTKTCATCSYWSKPIYLENEPKRSLDGFCGAICVQKYNLHPTGFPRIEVMVPRLDEVTCWVRTPSTFYCNEYERKRGD